MFIEIETLIVILVAIFGTLLIVPILKPLFGRRWEDKQLKDAEEKHRRAQKLLKAAELEAKALEAEVKADEVRDNVLNDKLK